jgi:predicted transcriptional regulator
MIEKDKSILIRLSHELAEQIQTWAAAIGVNKSALIRDGVLHYIEHLKKERPEIQELIRAVMITKLDSIQEEFNRGRVVAFTHIVKVSSLLNCFLCRDDEDREYIVYYLDQEPGETVIQTIDRHAERLYRVWCAQPESVGREFLLDLQQENVHFSIRNRE